MEKASVYCKQGSIRSAIRTFFIVSLLLIAGQSIAYENPAITHLGIGQGLSNNSVRCIFQDHQGYLWFGTYDGLNRYDGYGFKVFRNRLNDTTSLPHNYIYTIHEDVENKLWIGTGLGLAVYNRLNSSFCAAYYTSFWDKRKRKIGFNVNAVTSDVKGNVYIGSNGWGLIMKEAGSDVATQIPIKPKDEFITGYSVQSIVVDQSQRVWVYIIDRGLCEYKNGIVHIVNSDIKGVNTLEVDNNGHIWLGTNNGLYKYSIAKNAIVRQFKEEDGQLKSNTVASLCFDSKGDLWIGTDGGGLAILNVAKETLSYIVPGEGPENISSESIYALKKDRENRMWIGTIKGGVNIMDIQRSRFETVVHNRLDPNSLVNNFVSSFYEDDDGKLWIGTDGGGLSIWDKKQKKFTNYWHNANQPASLSNNSVTSILKDHRGNTWLATFGGGINRFNPSTKRFEYFKCINDSTGEENKNVWLLYEDRDKTLWATTFGSGKLYRFNQQSNRFEVFSQQLNDLIAITEDHEGNLWAGNSHNLIKIDKNGREHKLYQIGKPTRAIYEDSRHRLWLGTEGGGLVVFDKMNGKILARYSDQDGLSNNAVLNILEDDDGQLWISTFDGLSQFDPVSRKFKNFYQSDGLQSNQFSFGAAIKLQSGQLAFGGIAGFSIFYPKNIYPRNYLPAVLFTDINVNNKPLTNTAGYIGKSVDNVIEELQIPYNEAVLTFTFTALEYTSSEKIKYAYYLEGWDKSWNYTGNIRTINYNNLSEGNYTLRVKSTNAEGIWNTEETRLKVLVLPPWYRTWWAYSIYLLLLFAGMYVFFRYKARQAKLKYEIKLAHLNAEKEKEINDKRQAFFTNVSHEFRTPLTLIINPIKDLLKKPEPVNKTEQYELNIVYRNARRLLSLVDQLLLFRKAENISDQLRITKLNCCKTCKEIFLCFIQQANARNIEYIYECENENLEIYADREKIEIIFYNLISNALKYTQEGGKIIFKITETAGAVEITVTDNGYGMSKEAGKKLFEKFYQVKDKASPVKPGFGIGLYLVKQSVDSHKGSISYISEPGKGTSFKVVLKKGKAHFADQVIQEGAVDNPVLLEELAGDELEAHPVYNKYTPGGLEAVISEKASILIIDDNESMRKYVVSMFEDSFVVHEADKAEEGLKLAKQYQPDIIISDVVMGGMTGIEMCKIIKETPALTHIPVILLTGSFSPDSRLKGVEGGADDYITKPFEKDLLLARVSSLLKTRENLQKYFYNEITHQENSLRISAEYKEFLEKCIAIVENHLDNDDFTIQTLATEIGMSHSKLYKKIKAISGQSANSFIRFIRLRKAAELFINTNYNINETAFYVGIKDIKYFREQFYKTFGMKPSEYIEKYRKVFGKNYKLNERATKERD